jgi:hypothetical protein
MLNRKSIFSLLLVFGLCYSRPSASQTPDYSGDPKRIDTSSSIIFVGDVQLRGTPEILLGRENNKDAVRELLKKIAE